MRESDRLNGWKEIAVFLGKGVRSVQRWEREYGLPVHRIGRPGGEIIWASRAELNEWLNSRKENVAVARGADNDPPANSGDHEEQLPPVPLASTQIAHRPRPARWIVSGVVVLVALTWFAFASLGGPREPASWEVSGGRFIVLDRLGQPLFSKPFPFINEGGYSRGRESRLGGKVAFADLDNDGTSEVVFAAAAFVPNANAVFAYTADGAERFVIRPAHQVTFGSERYSAPWVPYRMFVAGEGPELSIFLVFIGSLAHPSLLLEVDRMGRVQSEYWSNGYIEWVVRAQWRGRPALFVGATHNDTRGASLAIFPDGRARGSAPAVQHEFQCANCPPGRPAEFFVFPRRAIAKAYPGGNGQASVSEVRVEENGTLRVAVGEGKRHSTEGVFESVVWYTLDSTLKPLEALVGSGVFLEHARQLALGSVTGPWGVTDEDSLFPVRRWANDRFIDLPRGRVVR